VRHRYSAVDFDARRPKPVCQFYIRQGHGSETGTCFSGADLARKHRGEGDNYDQPEAELLQVDPHDKPPQLIGTIGLSPLLTSKSWREVNLRGSAEEVQSFPHPPRFGASITHISLLRKDQPARASNASSMKAGWSPAAVCGKAVQTPKPGRVTKPTGSQVRPEPKKGVPPHGTLH